MASVYHNHRHAIYDWDPARVNLLLQDNTCQHANLSVIGSSSESMSFSELCFLWCHELKQFSYYLTIMLNIVDEHAVINLASYRDIGSLYFRTTLLHNCLYPSRLPEPCNSFCECDIDLYKVNYYIIQYLQKLLQ